MIKEHLEQLQSKLEQADGLPESTKADLLTLVAAVKQEVGLEPVPAQEPEEEQGLSKLMASVGELEASHPELAASVNQVINTLSKMGI